MSHPLSLRRSSRLLALFAGATLVPAAALVWLGVAWLDADRRLEDDRVRDLLRATAVRVSADLERDLAGLERHLAAPQPTSTESGSRLTRLTVSLDRDGQTMGAPAEPLLFTPVATPLFVDSRTPFWLEVERLESSDTTRPDALRRYAALASHPDSAIRAGALVRLARTLASSGRPDEALDAYARLAAITGATVAGDPVDLFARWARVDLLARLDRAEAADAEAVALDRDLLAGRWQLGRSSARAYLVALEPWRAAERAEAIASRTRAADAVAAIWRAWQARGLPAGSSRKAIDIEGHELLTLWHDHGDRLAVAAASPADLMAQPRFGTVDDLAVTLADAQGRALVSGTALRDAVAVVDRLPAESGLPWTVRVGARSTPIELAQTGATRRSLITAALLMFGLLIPATAYLVFSAVRRELALAAQQSEFVASVSHEFRSPLTSLTHLTSLLRSDFQPTDERRRQYYDTLARETDRLRRFVETLLDFGRIQSGRASYRLAAVDAAALVRGVVEDFGRHAAAGARPVSFTGPPVSLPVDADADALGRAIWNLLENAAKYSPDTAPIDVEVASEGHRVAIRVSDRGPGIRADERPNIFDPFYRGAQATQSAVKGTGVGLAIVRHIVTEHGGDVRVDNRVGGGSTFAIVLPAGGDAAAADTTRRVS